VRIDRYSSIRGLAAGLFVAAVGPAAAQTGQGGGTVPGPSLDMAVSGSQVLREELGGAPGDTGSECQAMLQQLDAMKHEPLRRSALWERYQAQCQAGLDGAPAYLPPLPQ